LRHCVGVDGFDDNERKNPICEDEPHQIILVETEDEVKYAFNNEEGKDPELYKFEGDDPEPTKIDIDKDGQLEDMVEAIVEKLKGKDDNDYPIEGNIKQIETYACEPLHHTPHGAKSRSNLRSAE
jgi:hypothetical protein